MSLFCGLRRSVPASPAILQQLETDVSPRRDDTSDEDSRFTDLVDTPNRPRTFFRWINFLFQPHDFKSNLAAFASRSMQLVRYPGQLAPLVFDLLSMSMSIWGGSQPGPDFVYPMSSLKLRKSGHLAKLILEHSRDHKELIRAATPNPNGSRVAVIDLDEVRPEIIERGYRMAADVHGLLFLIALVEILITLSLRIFWPFVGRGLGDLIRDLARRWFDDSVSAWIGYLVGVIHDAVINWGLGILVLCVLCGYAMIRGNGTLTLTGRSDSNAAGCTVLLDRDFDVIVTGRQSFVEAVTEGSFDIIHPISMQMLFGQELWHLAIEAVCLGVVAAIPAACFLLFFKPSILTVFAFNALGLMIALFTSLPQISSDILTFWEESTTDPLAYLKTAVRCIAVYLKMWPIVVLNINYLAIFTNAETQFRITAYFTTGFHLFPASFLVILIASSQNYHIRTARFLEVLGHPPVRKWEFETRAAAATFQCLVLCHGIPRPIQNIDVLAFLEVLIPDETELWEAWRRRVADRVVNEVDIRFALTIPMFRNNGLQGKLKELLDQAQSGHDEYQRFYNSTIAIGSL